MTFSVWVALSFLARKLVSDHAEVPDTIVGNALKPIEGLKCPVILMVII